MKDVRQVYRVEHHVESKASEYESGWNEGEQ